MIADLSRFIAQERPYWDELAARLDRMADDTLGAPDLETLQRVHYLHERAASGLARLSTYAAEPDTRAWLESLCARAYGEIHSAPDRAARFHPLRYLFGEFPRAVRRRRRALALAVSITLAGAAFGAVAIALDPQAKSLLPFGHAQIDPAERVQEEEQGKADRLGGHHGEFAADLFAHNTQVSIFEMALGAGWGIGTAAMLFYNAVILGAIIVDYVNAGQGMFVAGWLLPHGVVEIPAVVLAGQAGFVLAGAVIGRGRRDTLARRLRDAAGDTVAIIAGVAMLLVWAGFIESFLSQYHEPVIPYAAKIAFGLAEFIALLLFLTLAGRRGRGQTEGAGP